MSPRYTNAVVRSLCLAVLCLFLSSPHANTALLLPTDTTFVGALPSGEGLGRSITVSPNATVTLNELRLYFDPSGSDGVTIRYVLYHYNNPTEPLFTHSVFRTETSRGWYSSGTINWVLQPGQRYNIGAIAFADANYYRDNAIDSQNGLTSILEAPRFTTKGVAGYIAGIDGSMELYGNVSVVPEPVNTALFAFAGLFSSGYVIRRLRTRNR